MCPWDTFVCRRHFHPFKVGVPPKHHGQQIGSPLPFPRQLSDDWDLWGYRARSRELELVPWVCVPFFILCRDRKEKPGFVILEFSGLRCCQEHAVQTGHEDFLGVFVPGGPLTTCFRQLLQLPPFGLQLLFGQEKPAAWNAV